MGRSGDKGGVSSDGTGIEYCWIQNSTVGSLRISSAVMRVDGSGSSMRVIS